MALLSDDPKLFSPPPIGPPNPVPKTLPPAPSTLKPDEAFPKAESLFAALAKLVNGAVVVVVDDEPNPPVVDPAVMEGAPKDPNE